MNHLNVFLMISDVSLLIGLDDPELDFVQDMYERELELRDLARCENAILYPFRGAQDDELFSD